MCLPKKRGNAQESFVQKTMAIYKGYSERKNGNMYLSAKDQNAENISNRKAFFDSLGFNGYKIVAANLVHGTHIETITHNSPDFLLNTDALITKEKEIVLTLTGADCFPVYFEDSTKSVIGLAHCGWRGIIAGIVPKTIDRMISLGGEKENIRIDIGPGICMKHFEIKDNSIDSFIEYPESIQKADGRIGIDLRHIITNQAIKSGIPHHHISDTGKCTFCLSHTYFSYRRDKPKQLETQVAYITMQ